MPTWINHFRVADRLINRIDGIDTEYFVIGSIAPDCGKLDKSHGVYKPYTGITHFTKDIEYSKKTDCDYNFVYDNFVKNETDKKKRSFYLAYYVHLFEDCVFANNVFAPIENEYGDFRFNEKIRKQVAKERNNTDFLFLENNVSQSYEILKKCKPFDESYPEWYKHSEIAEQMKNIVAFYSNSKCEQMDYAFISPMLMDKFVSKTVKLLEEDFKEKGIVLKEDIVE